jgi:hypothetical protein
MWKIQTKMNQRKKEERRENKKLESQDLIFIFQIKIFGFPKVFEEAERNV